MLIFYAYLQWIFIDSIVNVIHSYPLLLLILVPPDPKLHRRNTGDSFCDNGVPCKMDSESILLFRPNVGIVRCCHHNFLHKLERGKRENLSGEKIKISSKDRSDLKVVGGHLAQIMLMMSMSNHGHQYSWLHVDVTNMKFHSEISSVWWDNILPL